MGDKRGIIMRILDTIMQTIQVHFDTLHINQFKKTYTTTCLVFQYALPFLEVIIIFVLLIGMM